MVPPRLLRLHASRPDQLPSHPNLSSAQPKDVSLPSLPTFVEQILVEASQLIDHDLQDPAQFSCKGKRPSKPSIAEVELLTCARTIEIGHTGSGPSNGLAVKIGGATKVVENWFARRSVHDAGEVSWEEFEAGLCDEHSKHEGDYTPDVYDVREVCRWDLGGEEIDEWRDVGLGAYEMCHKIPFPLSNRVFTTLVCTAKHATHQRFIVAQIPLDFTSVPAAIYSSGANKTQGITPEQKKKVVLGQYVSVERCRAQEDGKVLWEMGTASDAKGVLPMGVQKLALPGAIIKDVGWFVGWTKARRSNGQVEDKVPRNGAAS